MGQKTAEIVRIFGQGTTSECTAERWFQKFRSEDEDLKDEGVFVHGKLPLTTNI